MLLHYINDDILTYHPSYSGEYQDEANELDLYQDILIFEGWNQTKKTEETAVHIDNSVINI